MEYKKKLIEVALPLEAINAEASREKSIRHGHPSTLHLWWSRKPTAAVRAVLWASLVDDPSSHPGRFPTPEAQQAERERLFGILTELIKWENSNDDEVVQRAKEEILRSTDGEPPALLDPFAGGGTIPLEAQRLGLAAHASDLNPVAVMINKAMIEIPPRFAGKPPVNRKSRGAEAQAWEGAAGLAEDVKFYGTWMKEEALRRIGHLYPTVQDEHGSERPVIAWLWARTVKCPNPACRCEMPLASQFELSKKYQVHVQPIIAEGSIRYEVRHGEEAPQGTVSRRGASCIACGTPVGFAYIRGEGQAGRMGTRLMAVVAEGEGGRLYLPPDAAHVHAAQVPRPEDYPDGPIPHNPRDFKTPNYGLEGFADLFTNRQLVALTTFSSLVREAQAQAERDALAAGMAGDDVPLAAGGTGAKAYGEAVAVYLAFLVDKLLDYHSALCSWNISRDVLRNTFVRQAMPMAWDFAEANPFSGSTGSFESMLSWIGKALLALPAAGAGYARQSDAQSDLGLRDIMVSTDPPYYDSIGYGDLSDFFYLWMRRSLQHIYPEMFCTMLVPKGEELVAVPYRFDGHQDEAKGFFEEGMLRALQQVYSYSRDDVPVTIYYAFKQRASAGGEGAASTGWETMLTAIVKAGFVITGTWPIRTERPARNLSLDSNALASSIVLVCRKRPEDAPVGTRRDFTSVLKRELRPALERLRGANIAPVDLAQSAIGPGMAVFSRYANVLEADGTPMSIRTALEAINEELDLYFSQQDSELDAVSRFCVALYTQFAFAEVSFGEADILARAKNVALGKLAENGMVHAHKGKVRLLNRDEISARADYRSTWLLTQQLTRAVERAGAVGAAEIVSQTPSQEVEKARALVYWLYTIAERKGWAAEAYAYNSLVTLWRDIQAKAGELGGHAPKQPVLKEFW